MSPPVLRPFARSSSTFVHSFLRSASTSAPRTISKRSPPRGSSPGPHPERLASRRIPHAAPAPTSTASVSSPSNPAPSVSPTSQLPPLPYHVHRTPSQQLPVYHDAKRGGNLHQTRIQKIEGDVDALRAEIQVALDLKEEHIVINRLNKHIVIKGWLRKEVAEFLRSKHF